MRVFEQDFASYYDLLYAGKDYVAEVNFIRDVIERHRHDTRTILDLGCGTARHAVEFARAGLSVTGVDRSADMIAKGRERIAQLPPELQNRLALAHGDVTEYRSSAVYDAVISLFHVVSYQTTNTALHGIFNSARAALTTHGLFVFDFWYGPGVLAEPPEVRVKRVHRPDVHVTRIAEPQHHVNSNLVEVKYTLVAVNQKTRRAVERTELHSMRYLFLPEIELFAGQAGFEVVEIGESLSRKSLSSRSWSAYVAARVITNRQ